LRPCAAATRARAARAGDLRGVAWSIVTACADGRDGGGITDARRHYLGTPFLTSRRDAPGRETTFIDQRLPFGDVCMVRANSIRAAGNRSSTAQQLGTLGDR
ncbi:MAG: hypothetical protein M3417_10505, partial [Actinomycetota bacterium]|nr:hypothetical protein [Actinomycetota bacterium]